MGLAKGCSMARSSSSTHACRLVQGLTHGGQAKVFGDFDIVIADDRQIVRHTQAQPHGRLPTHPSPEYHWRRKPRSVGQHHAALSPIQASEPAHVRLAPHIHVGKGCAPFSTLAVTTQTIITRGKIKGLSGVSPTKAMRRCPGPIKNSVTRYRPEHLPQQADKLVEKGDARP